jgi:uncharacterized cupredoxin-like copper-binding protein
MMPSRSLPRLFAVFAAPALAACAAAPLRDGVYPLRPEQSVALSRGLTLTYDSFSDSRCPANAQCVWAGRLVFRFVIDGPDGREEFSLGPDQPTATPAALHGARVALDMKAVPPARASAATRPGDVLPVTLRISTAGAAGALPSTHAPRP